MDFEEQTHGENNTELEKKEEFLVTYFSLHAFISTARISEPFLRN
jgi:hypothetical protein